MKKYYLITDDFIENTFYVYDDLINYINNYFYNCVHEIKGILEIDYLKDGEFITTKPLDLRKVIYDVDDLRIDIISNREYWKLCEDDNRLRLSDLI
jgi:hypothetical protein